MKNKITPTSLDYAILGLIKDDAQSGYGIRKVFETTALGTYSNSPGSIYPALKRLQKFNLVINKPDVKDGKNKFFITKAGRKRLRDWAIQPLTQTDVERKTNEIMLRFAFMEGLVNNKEVLHFLQTYKELLTAYLKDLRAFQKAESPTLPLHGRLAFEFGIESHKTTLKWCKKALSEFTLLNKV